MRPARGGEGKPGLFYGIHTLPRFLDPPEPSSPKLRADSQGGTPFARSVASVVVVDHAEGSAEGGLRVCRVALVWVRGQLASEGTFWASLMLKHCARKQSVGLTSPKPHPLFPENLHCKEKLLSGYVEFR